jgi:SAM-dependent methyltransferase
MGMHNQKYSPRATVSREKIIKAVRLGLTAPWHILISTGIDTLKSRKFGGGQIEETLLKKLINNHESYYPSFKHRLNGLALLRGRGIEVGALHHPCPLPANTEVDYVDAVPKAEVIRLFPEVDASKIVDPKYIVDLDTQGLSPLADESQDFAIINHVIEHVANPIATILEVTRVLRSGGYAVISAPDMRFTFDKDRALTSWEHLVGEYESNTTEISDAHYLDFLHAVHPEVFERTPEDIQKTVASVRARREHAHVWTSKSFREFLNKVFVQFAPGKMAPVFESMGNENKFEYFSVWKKV